MKSSYCKTPVQSLDLSIRDAVKPLAAEELSSVQVLRADRSWSNESEGAEMFGCVAENGIVIAYFPSRRGFEKYAEPFAEMVKATGGVA